MWADLVVHDDAGEEGAGGVGEEGEGDEVGAGVAFDEGGPAVGEGAQQQLRPPQEARRLHVVLAPCEDRLPCLGVQPLQSPFLLHRLPSFSRRQDPPRAFSRAADTWLES
eukprot:2662390-Rhodomonas_salina.1